MRISFDLWADGKEKALTLSYGDGNYADCSIVHNPTATTLWFTAGPNKVSIKAGETKVL